MPSLIDAYNFDASVVEKPKKRKTFDEVLANIEPAISGAVKNIKDYQDRTARQKEMDEAIANGTEGYEWFNPEDPAHKALIEEYVRTGNANGIAQQRGMWASQQELKKSKEGENAEKIKGFTRGFNRSLVGLQAWDGAEAGPEATAQINQHALSAQENIDDLKELGVDVTELQAQLDKAKGVKQVKVDEQQAEIDEKAAQEEAKKAKAEANAVAWKKKRDAARTAFEKEPERIKDRVRRGKSDYMGFTKKELGI